MTNVHTLTAGTVTEREAVTVAARSALAASVTLTKRGAVLADALASLRTKAEADGGTFRQYVTMAAEAIRAAGDWTKASADVRQAVAVVAGTSGGLSSVMVAEAVGLSQSTASRAIRAAKAATVAEATEAARTEAERVAAEADDATEASTKAAGREAAKAAKAKAEREAARVITRSGVVTTSGRGDNGTRTKRGASVLSTLTEATKADALAALADGSVSADDLRALAATLAGMAERVAEAAPTVAEREAEAKAATEAAEATKAAEREAKATEAAEAKATKAAERAEAKAARDAEREAKAAERATAKAARKVRPVLAVTLGAEAVADMTDAEAVAAGERVAKAATLALAEGK